MFVQFFPDELKLSHLVRRECRSTGKSYAKNTIGKMLGRVPALCLAAWILLPILFCGQTNLFLRKTAFAKHRIIPLL